MGLFSSKYKTHVGTNSSRVIPDNTIPNAIQTGYLAALVEHDDQVIEHVMDAMSNSVGMKAHMMYNYAKTNYAYGLPTSKIHKADSAKNIIQPVLAGIAGGVITMDYYYFAPFNNLHSGWKHLVDNLGFNEETNEITVLTTAKAGKKVYLKDMIVVVNDATVEEINTGTLDQWGRVATAGFTPERRAQTAGSGIGVVNKATGFAVDATAPQDYIRIQYVWEVDQVVVVEGVNVTRKVVMEEFINVNVIDFDEEAEYHQAKYYVNGQAKYFIYKHGSGTYPTLDAVYSDDYDDLGSFFPFAYMRFNKTSMLAMDKTTPEYKTNRKLFKYLGMDFEEITENVHQNPGIAQIEQAMMVMAVPADTENPLEIKYLYDFFSGVYTEGGGTSTSNTTAQIAERLGTPTVRSSIIIQDKRFKMALSYARLHKRKVQGSIGPVGTYKMVKASEAINKIGNGLGDFITVHITIPIMNRTYQKQITETVYEQVDVLDLKMTYNIFGEYTATNDGVDDILLIPLDHSITKGYLVTDREVLYSRSLHFVFNSKIDQEIKWYQSGVFKVIMAIAALVIIIYTWGAAAPAIAAAYAAGGIIAAAYVVAVMVIKYLVVSALVKLFVRKIGYKWAIIAAIVAAAYGFNVMSEVGTAAEGLLVTAESMLQVAGSLVSEVGKQIGQDIQNIFEEMKSFDAFAKEKYKELEKKNALLDNNVRQVPFLVFGEKPSEYYDRTVHSGNIGVLSLDVISSYVDSSLMLPKISDTLQEENV